MYVVALPFIVVVTTVMDVRLDFVAFGLSFVTFAFLMVLVLVLVDLTVVVVVDLGLVVVVDLDVLVLEELMLVLEDLVVLEMTEVGSELVLEVDVELERRVLDCVLEPVFVLASAEEVARDVKEDEELEPTFCLTSTPDSTPPLLKAPLTVDFNQQEPCPALYANARHCE